MRRTLALSLLLAGLTVRAELSADLAQCAGLADTAVRLACFDALAKQTAADPPPVAMPPTAEPENLWLTESRLATEMSGWQKNQPILLENGQVWRCLENPKFLIPPAPKGAKVSIERGFFGSAWMQIEGLESRIRVSRDP